MVENMIDVLIYLYENYMDGEQRGVVDQTELEMELSVAGFTNNEIAQALRWLDELARRMEATDDAPRSVNALRIYTDTESRKLDIEVRGLLLSLEQSGILDPLSRELVIERAVAIEQDVLTVDELGWIVLLVLMNRPGRESAFNQMEEMVYGEAPALLH